MSFEASVALFAESFASMAELFASIAAPLAASADASALAASEGGGDGGGETTTGGGDGGGVTTVGAGLSQPANTAATAAAASMDLIIYRSLGWVGDRNIARENRLGGLHQRGIPTHRRHHRYLNFNNNETCIQLSEQPIPRAPVGHRPTTRGPDQSPSTVPLTPASPVAHISSKRVDRSWVCSG
jgi:hypothetical protein